MNLSGMLRVNIIMQNLTPTLSGTSGAQVFVSIPLFLCLMFIYTLPPKYFLPYKVLPIQIKINSNIIIIYRIYQL